MDLAIFRERLHYYLALAEKNQKSLAAALNLHPNVLSRKLNNTNKAIFSHSEIKELIRVLIQWGSLNYRGEVTELLELIGFKTDGFFTAREWQLSPFNTLEDGFYSTVKNQLSALKSDLPTLKLAAASPNAAIPSASTLSFPALIANLPPEVSSLIGRKREISELVAILNEKTDMPLRLVTLTGVGGTGKTRLALGAAAKLLPFFRDGIYFLGLENVTEKPILVSELVETLGISGLLDKALTDVLKKYLSSRQMLLILDNFEQLVENGATLLPELLRAAPELKILVTSRFPLQLSVEHEFRVTPLQVPSPVEIQTDFDLIHLEKYPALALFIARAQAVKPEFRLTTENKQVVAEICRKLDGLPLALELAAARLRAFPAHTLLERLSLKLLKGGARDLPARQQTLRSTIEWSYELLSKEEQALFARLSIFSGGFNLEAAEVVCQVEDAEAITPLDGIESLLLKNLIRQWEDKSGATRYGMFQTIGEFGQEKLKERGEEVQLRRQYASFYLNFAHNLEPVVKSKDQATALQVLDSEYDNLRMILSTGLKEGEVATTQFAVELAISLDFFWDLRNYLTEGRAYLELALSLTKPHTLTYIQLLNRLAKLTFRLGNNKLAQSYSEAALVLSRQSGDKFEAGLALHRLGLIANQKGNLSASRQYFEDSLILRREVEDKFGVRLALQNLAQIYFDLGEYDKARIGIEESLKGWREAGDRRGISITLSILGFLTCWVYHDFDRARSYFEEVLALSSEISDKYGAAFGWIGYGEIAFARGDYKEAQQNMEMGLSLGQEMGDTFLLGCCLTGLGNVYLEQHDMAKSRQYYQESLVFWGGMGNKEWVAKNLAGLSRISSLLFNNLEGLTYTARLGGAINNLITPEVGLLSFQYKHYYDKALQMARFNLGDEDFNRLFAQGSLMSLEEAIKFGLTWKSPIPELKNS